MCLKILAGTSLFFLLFFLLPTVYAKTELARVNKTVISVEELNKKFKEGLKLYQFKLPTKAGFLEDLIKRELGIQEAKRLGLDKDPDVQDKMNTLLYHALIEKQLQGEFDKIQISDDEAKGFYSKYPEIRTSHIFVAVRPGATSEEEKKAKKKIEAIRDDYLKDGKMSFSEVAQRYSEGIAAPVGGDIDYQSRDRLDPIYYDAALKLKNPGKISPIIRTQFGYHIIKLTALKLWEDVDKAQVKRLLFDELRAKVFEKYMNKLKEKAKITINKAPLKW